MQRETDMLEMEMYMRNELFIPYVEDFQVILKDKEGKILVPVCNSGCGSVEDSQGRYTREH